jgi:hypothetical protein
MVYAGYLGSSAYDTALAVCGKEAFLSVPSMFDWGQTCGKPDPREGKQGT